MPCLWLHFTTLKGAVGIVYKSPSWSAWPRTTQDVEAPSLSMEHDPRLLMRTLLPLTRNGLVDETRRMKINRVRCPSWSHHACLVRGGGGTAGAACLWGKPTPSSEVTRHAARYPSVTAASPCASATRKCHLGVKQTLQVNFGLQGPTCLLSLSTPLPPYLSLSLAVSKRGPINQQEGA